MNSTPTLMLAITQPGAKGITTQASSASIIDRNGARKNTNLSAPAGMTISFTTYFSASATDLQQTPRPDHVRTAAHLHGGPDLAVAIDQKQQRDHHEGDDRPDPAPA